MVSVDRKPNIPNLKITFVYLHLGVCAIDKATTEPVLKGDKNNFLVKQVVRIILSRGASKLVAEYHKCFSVFFSLVN